MDNLQTDSVRLNGFRGDFSFTVEKEFIGRPYVPSEYSGVTLDIGLDLAFTRITVLVEAYGHILDNDQRFACMRCRGLVGRDAEILLGNDTVLQSIEITLEDAISAFPVISDEIWEAIKRRWPKITKSPSSVHTAILDVVWDRGPLNKHLHVFDYPIRKEKWTELAEVIGCMQQRHKQEAVRKRRREAASLISNGSSS